MIVRLMGGLGNQMFQYAFGRSVSLVRKEPLAFTIFYLGKNNGAYTERSYSLDAFNVKEMKFEPAEVPAVWDEGHFAFQFHPEVYTTHARSFIGCYQSEKYFNVPIVRAELTLRNKPGKESLCVADQIAQAGAASAFLHIRRGDYLAPSAIPFHGMPTMKYYNEAIARIRANYEDVHFFVFSDDPEWCCSAFPDFTVVCHNKQGDGNAPGQEHEDLWLMSLCRHAIIANSSFSWWGAWLGDTQPDRLVFAPARWFADKGPACAKDIVPDRWIKLVEATYPGAGPCTGTAAEHVDFVRQNACLIHDSILPFEKLKATKPVEAAAPRQEVLIEKSTSEPEPEVLVKIMMLGYPQDIKLLRPRDARFLVEQQKAAIYVK